MAWTIKEKYNLLQAVREIAHPRIPDDLMKIQRCVPNRSMAEVESHLKHLLKGAKAKDDKYTELYSSSYAKKWIDGCDRRTGIEATCSNRGVGNIQTCHPATSLSTVITDLNASVPSLTRLQYGDKVIPLNWHKVHWFIEQVILGNDPLEESNFINHIEAALLVELLHDTFNCIDDCHLAPAEEYLFKKYREQTTPIMKDEFHAEIPLPNSLHESKFFNPYGMPKRLSQVVESAPNPLRNFVNSRRASMEQASTKSVASALEAEAPSIQAVRILIPCSFTGPAASASPTVDGQT